jgi:hypothetical protein
MHTHATHLHTYPYIHTHECVNPLYGPLGEDEEGQDIRTHSTYCVCVCVRARVRVRVNPLYRPLGEDEEGQDIRTHSTYCVCARARARVRVCVCVCILSTDPLARTRRARKAVPLNTDDTRICV